MMLILLLATLALANDSQSEIVEVPSTLTQEVCQHLHASYQNMGTPVATVTPFETGREYAVLHSGNQTWNVHYRIQDEAVLSGFLWNSLDAANYQENIYVSSGDWKLNHLGECQVMYRRFQYRGYHRIEIGRVLLNLLVIEETTSPK